MLITTDIRLSVSNTGKAIPLQALDRPLGLQGFGGLPEFLDSRHWKVAWLSAISTGRFYSQERFLVLSSVRAAIQVLLLMLRHK